MSGFDNEVLYCIGERLQPSTTQAITLMQKTGDDVSEMNVVGSPEGVHAANPSSLAHDRAGGQLYLKRSGVGNTGWLPISTNSQDLHTASFIVSAAGTNGTGANYGNIASAVAAAGNGDTIFIMPGTYTENLTVNKNLIFCSYTAALRGGQNVAITGKITVSSADISLGFNGIRFNTNADNSFSLTGNASAITCVDCYFNASNATSINATGNSSTAFYMENCSGFLGNTFALFTSTNTALWMKDSTFIDATTPGTSTVSASSIRLINSYLSIPFSTTGTGALIIENTSFGGQQSPYTNTTWVTTAGTETSFIDNTTFNSGTASAISVGAGTTLIAVGLRVNSSNANAITGAGTIFYGPITFSGSSSTINTSTQTELKTQLGSLNIKTPLSVSSPVPLVRDSSTGDIGVGSDPTIVTIFDLAQSGTTWTKNSSTKVVEFFVWSGGGGGGSGRAAASNQSGGGSGGGAGYFSYVKALATSITASPITITVGAGGNGGASVTGGVNGNPGIIGGSSSVGSIFTIPGGNPGAAGINGTANGVNSLYNQIFGLFDVNANSNLSGNGTLTTSNPSTVLGAYTWATSGAGAAGLSLGTPRAGAAAASILDPFGNVLLAGGLAGATTGAVAGNGNSPTSTTGMMIGGTGGGSGGISAAGVSGGGGNGAVPGGGGGGGAGTLTGNNSGAGGNGAAGRVIIIEWL